MSHRTLLLLLPGLLSACASGGALDPGLARVVDEVVTPLGLDAGSARVFRVGAVSPDTALTEALPADLGEGASLDAALLWEDAAPAALDVPGEGTLWLVDAAPDALWSHPAHLVVVPADGGDLTVHDVSSWPLLDGEAFTPWTEAADWGVPHDPVDPNHEPTVTATPAGGVAQRSLDATCSPEVTDVALVLEGSPQRRVRRTGAEMAVALANVGFEVTRVQSGADPRANEQALLSALSQLAARPDLGEVVVYYVGHGSPSVGSWALGSSATGYHRIDQLEVRDRLAALDARRLSLVSESCHSGWWADTFPAVLQEDTRNQDFEIEAVATSSSAEAAWVNGFVAQASWAMLPVIARGGSPRIDWSAALPGPMPTPDRRPGVVQTPQRAHEDPKRPDLHLMPHPGDGRCLAAALDRDDYSRRVNLTGAWFGDAEGTVSLEDPWGESLDLEVAFWSDTGVSVYLPMRRDGFASDGIGLHSVLGEGHYRVTVTRADGGDSDDAWDEDDHPSHVHLPLQVYTQDYTPDVPGGWAELWHPLTPVSRATDGPTLQASALLLPSADLEPDLDDLDDLDALHETSATLQATPGWGYELLPARRDLSTAHDQRNPDVSYYGFRVVFGEDWSDTRSWRSVLAYD